MPLRSAAAAVILVSSSILAGESSAGDIRRGTFVCKMMGQEISRESFEIREDGWWAKGKLDLFGQTKNEYEITEKRSDGKTVLTGSSNANDVQSEFVATFEQEKATIEVTRGGKTQSIPIDLKGKSPHVPFINLSWIFFEDVGRLVAARAAAGSLPADFLIHAVDLGSAQTLSINVKSFGVSQKPLGAEMVPIFAFEVGIAGQVEASLHTTASGVPVFFGVPAQKLDVVVEGYEALKPAEKAPSTIVDSGEWRARLSKAEHKIASEKKVMIPMRDGVKLAADVYRPEIENRKVPTILVRTPYGRAGEGIVKGNAFAPRGYAVVAQDVRGRGDSEGTFVPVFNEAQDGSETLDWIAKQPWSDGNVGMIGGSYVAWVQWLAASTGNKHLKAIVPQVSPPDPHENIPYDGGSFVLSTAWWAVAVQSIAEGKSPFRGDVDYLKAFATLPLTDIDKALSLPEKTFLDEWIAHPQEDPYWEPLRYQQRFASIDVPALNISGWWDGDQPGAPLNFAGMRKHGKSERARKGQMLVMGPWTHIFNTFSKVGDHYDFGPDALVDLDSVSLRFFDRYLKGIENGIENEDPVLVFTMFENKWHREKDWPLPQTKWTKLFLGGSGTANKKDGGGTLSLENADSPADTYVYDPMRLPDVPDIDFSDVTGKQISMDLSGLPDRDDVLDFLSPPLAGPVEITGPVSAVLSVTTDAKDTDFAVGIYRIEPSGYTTAVRGGIQRLKYRNGWDKPSFAKPGEVSTLTIDCWATGLRLSKGDRLLVEVQSNGFPGHARNLNTGEPDAAATKAVVARQTLFHDAARPSYVLLPVIPREDAPGLRFETKAED